jgi:hypothetical protein
MKLIEKRSTVHIYVYRCCIEVYEHEHDIFILLKIGIIFFIISMSFYLGLREAEYLKAYADNHETSISELVRDKLKPLLKQLKA